MWRQYLLNCLREDKDFLELAAGIEQGRRFQMAWGLGGTPKALFLASLFAHLRRFLLVIVPDEETWRQLQQDAEALLGEDAVFFFPPEEIVAAGAVSRSPERAAQRIKAMSQALEGKACMVIAPFAALQRRLLSPRVWGSCRLLLKAGMEAERGFLAERLEAMGYLRVDVVDAPGQYAVRGGIVDVFPLTAELPARIELDGDVVVSLRAFSPVSQRTMDHLSEFSVWPASELVLGKEERETLRERLRQEGLAEVRRWERDGKMQTARRLNRHLEAWQELLENALPGELEFFLPLLPGGGATFFEYLPPNAVAVADEPHLAAQEMAQRQEERGRLWEELIKEGKALTLFREKSSWDWEAAASLLGERPFLQVGLFPRQILPGKMEYGTSFSFTGLPSFARNRAVFLSEMRQWLKEGQQVLLLCGSEERAGRWQEGLRSEGIAAVPVSELPAAKERKKESGNRVFVGWGNLREGFRFPSRKLAVVTENEIGWESRRRSRSRLRAADKPADRLSAFVELKAGDYVVHSVHGIGRYLGVECLSVAGVQRDYLVIQYAGTDRLYVPTDQVHLLQKYIGAEGTPPRLSRLGGGDWERIKSRVKASVQELARELLSLYAERQALPGHSFSPDTVWQKEFEDAFPYEETSDQRQAIAEVKRDMESPRVMDRLICGDVGYGKTEVALRAAFKAVMDGKQVAVLVPTTVLAQQHFYTFKERFANYPVTVEVLSRFRSLREQREVISRTELGQVDILIGTHRLLSGDVKFRDLGLLIIDEEQRFGVVQKEKLKQLRRTVDVLTLTATPIPRTLHMALVGVRDMSIIETPPEGRQPVQTYVIEYQPELLREAVRRELSRGGQVFWVHNRIQELPLVARRVQHLVPEARLVMAHGQMPEEQLEKAMWDFIQGKYDVLVSTAIIESGLDIPNVNTLIVEDADHFGLSQLYQLRGRVGRSERQAYAYFTYRRDRVLSEVAEKRLRAIQEFTEFGAGFKIAMRDLEIRGAGNLLGPEQHGHIAAVGFDMYCRLLEESVRELKGEPLPPPAVLPAADLPVDAYIPEDYVGDARLKIEIYRRLLLAEKPEDIKEVEEELVDRFGPLPAPVQRLLRVSSLRHLAQRAGVTALQMQPDGLRVRFGSDFSWSAEALAHLHRRLSRQAPLVKRVGSNDLLLRVQGVKDGGWMNILEEVLLAASIKNSMVNNGCSMEK